MAQYFELHPENPQPRLLKQAVIFDGRNIYDPTLVEDEGLAYYGIGRGRSLHAQGAAHG